jgi:hypothetical protein
LAGAALSVFAIRPSNDDVDYVSKAIYYFENPSEQLDYFYREYALLDFRMYSPIQITQMLELLWAFIARLTHAPFVDIYWFAAPALGGFLIPLAWFLVYSRFTKNTKFALLGALAVVAFLCLDGAQNRSFGNFAFVKIWQAKVLLMAVLLPLFTAYSVDLFRQPDLARWLRLFLLSTACAGVSSSALFLLPALAVSLAAAFLAAGKSIVLHIKTLFMYFLSLAHVALISFYLMSYARNHLSGKNAFTEGWPTTFDGAYRTVFGEYYSFSSIIFVVSTVLCLLLLRGPARLFLSGWILCVFGIWLNPLFSDFIIGNVTSANGYWRLFYVTPFPLAIGIAVISSMQDRTLPRSVPRLVAGFLVVVPLVVNTIPIGRGVFTKANKVEFGLRHKVRKSEESKIKRIIDRIPDGPMLAPKTYSWPMVMFTSRKPQVAIRRNKLRFYGAINGRPELERERSAAVNFVSGRDPEGYEAFTGLLGGGLKTVIISEQIAADRKVKRALAKNGFVFLDTIDKEVIFVKQTTKPVDRKDTE